MPIVSVIIPAYNSGPYLDEAVKSVIAQTFTDWECIVVDDGSTEDLSRVEKMDSRVRLIRQLNSGTSAARNNGFMSSGGEFIAFLDHDDLWLPTMLANQLEEMEVHPEAALCYTAFDLINSIGERQGPGWGRGVSGYVEYLRGIGGPLPSCALIRRSCLLKTGLFDPLYPMVQDFDLFLKIFMFHPVRFIPTTRMLYRIHEANTSRNYVALHGEVVNVVNKHILMARLRGNIAAIKAGRICIRRRCLVSGAQAYDAARECVHAGKMAKCLPHLLRAVIWSPRYTLTSLFKFPFRWLKKRTDLGGVPDKMWLQD